MLEEMSELQRELILSERAQKKDDKSLKEKFRPKSRSEDDGSLGDDAMIDSDDERSEGLTFDDIKEITIRRSKLAKWFMEPFFEELIVGCFVRDGIGRSKSGAIYRLCMVRNVDASYPDRHYKLENKTTHKYLNVVWGNENSAARRQMAMISNSELLEGEFKQWIREVEDVVANCQAKRTGGEDPDKITAIKSTSAITPQPAEMNRKNRVENFKNASELKPKNIGLKVGNASYDPFSRRWTRSRNYYVSKPGEKKEEAEAIVVADGALADIESNGTAVVGAVRAGMAATAAALEAAAGAGKLIDTSAPVDFGTESNLKHNFELPISLAALQKFGGPRSSERVPGKEAANRSNSCVPSPGE
ncbi:unnamed protein product [Malus baccata var. baccata]